jgi:hypothetical protein
VTRCAVDDSRLAELSGLAITGEGLWAMADGGRRIELHRLDPSTCSVVETRIVAVDPYDAEDLARGPDGSLWVGDVGDNERRRPTVAVIVVPRTGEPQVRRFTYPDGAQDAEALLVGADGVPTVITKEIGRAAVYRPQGAPTASGPTPLVHVADIQLPGSDTVGGPIGQLGAGTVTGAALSPDGRVVALRTYTDAWLFAVPDGDPRRIGDALREVPVRVPLPDEPQGEALAFTADGALLSGSETRSTASGEIREVPGAAALVISASSGRTAGPTGPVAAGGSSGAQPVPDEAGAGRPGPAPPSPWLPAALGAGALIALLGLVAAVMLRHSSRRR